MQPSWLERCLQQAVEHVTMVTTTVMEELELSPVCCVILLEFFAVALVRLNVTLALLQMHRWPLHLGHAHAMMATMTPMELWTVNFV